MTGVEVRRWLQGLLDRRPDLAWDHAAELAAMGSPEEQHAAHRYLRRIAELVPNPAWGRERRTQAARLRFAPREERREIGVMRFPVVPGGGEESWFAEARVEVIASREDRVPDGLEERAARAARRAFGAAREVLGTAARFTVEVPRVEGGSLGLAVGLAACSAARANPIGEAWSATGELDETGHVRGVGHLPEKQRLHHIARPRGNLLVPASSGCQGRARIQEVEHLRDALHAMAIPPSADPAAELAQVQGQFVHGDWVAAAAAGERLRDHPGLEDAERLELLALLLTARNHQSNGAAARELVEELKAMVAAAVPSLALARAVGSTAIHFVDEFQPDRAREAFAVAGHFTDWRPDERVHLDGSAALLALLEGDRDRALALRQDNVRRASPDERPRCLGDLAEALRRCGRPGDALDAAQEALRAIERRPGGYRNQTRPFVRLYAARACRALGDRRAALQHLERAEPPSGTDVSFRIALERAALEESPDRARDAYRLLGDAREARVYRALYFRTLVSLGDTTAESPLRDAMLASNDVAVAELSARIPY